MATGNVPQDARLRKPPEGISRVALNARVSTLNNGQDPTMQTRELEEYCQRRGWEIAGCYVDNGISGSKESRPELDRLMTDAHQRRFDAVLVWKLDRFGRSLRHLVNALAEFESLGVAFVSLRDNLDLSTPSGRLMFQIIGAMAEFERSLIVERVKAGMRNARAKGKRIGRPPRTYLSPEVRQSIGEAYRNEEGSLRQLAARFGTSVGMVQRCTTISQDQSQFDPGAGDNLTHARSGSTFTNNRFHPDRSRQTAISGFTSTFWLLSFDSYLVSTAGTQRIIWLVSMALGVVP